MCSIHRGALLCGAAVVLLLSSAVAQDTTNETTIPTTTSPNRLQATGPEAPTNMTVNMTSMQQAVPAFTGIRSCLPFNILVAAASTTSDTSSSSTNGSIVIQAEYNVINSTVAAIKDGILTLSLSGGFDSRQPINFTVVVPGGTSQLRYVANYGSGLVVLGPGHNVSSIRLVSPTVGQIEAVNLTAESVSLQSSGVLGSSVSGSIKRADISSTGTGSIAFTSDTPVQMTLRLSGITTIVADVPAGSSITGTAGGLSKVQYTGGTCSVTSDTPVLFPAPSIFGGAGFGFGGGGSVFGQKCQKVTTAQLQPVVAAAANPQWTCGIIVDGNLSCQSGNATVLPWNVTAAPSAAAAGATGTITPGAGANTGTTTPNAAGSNTATTTPPSVNSIGIGSNAAGTAGGNTTSTGGTNAGANNAGQTATTAVEPPGTNTGGAGRRLLQPLVTTTVPAGTIGTGAQTSGPGTFASGTGSVLGPAGTTTQTTSSREGSQPQTTLSTGGVGSNLYNPVYVPATPAQTFAAETNASGNVTAPAAAATSTTTAPTTSVSISTSGVGGPSVSTSTSGPGAATGVAVASTTCASKAQSLSMLVQPLRQGMTAGTGTGAGAGGAMSTSTSSATSSATAGSPSTTPNP